MSKQKRYFFRKTITGQLAAVDQMTQEWLATVNTTEILTMSAHRARNPGFHALFFGILGFVFKNQEKYLSEEALRFAVTVAAGFVEEVRVNGDKVALMPKSLAWANMDETEFQHYFPAAMQAIKQLLPQFEGIDLEQAWHQDRSVS